MRINQLLIIFIVTMAFMNCQKKADFDKGDDDPIVQRFLEVPSSSFPEVKAIAAIISRQNKKENYLNGLAERIGFPV